MSEKEKIIKLTENTNQICDIVSKVLENPVLKENLDKEQVLKLNQVSARICRFFFNFRDNTLKNHPELKSLPWVKEFARAARKLNKIMRDFDEIGLSKETIFLKRKFWRRYFLTETLIKIYEKIVTGQRKPATDQERKILDKISKRISSEIEDTIFIFGKEDQYYRWFNGIINQDIQIVQNIHLIEKEV